MLLTACVSPQFQNGAIGMIENSRFAAYGHDTQVTARTRPVAVVPHSVRPIMMGVVSHHGHRWIGQAEVFGEKGKVSCGPNLGDTVVLATADGLQATAPPAVASVIAFP